MRMSVVVGIPYQSAVVVRAGKEQQSFSQVMVQGNNLTPMATAFLQFTDLPKKKNLTIKCFKIMSTSSLISTCLYLLVRGCLEVKVLQEISRRMQIIG